MQFTFRYEQCDNGWLVVAEEKLAGREEINLVPKTEHWQLLYDLWIGMRIKRLSGCPWVASGLYKRGATLFDAVGGVAQLNPARSLFHSPTFEVTSDYFLPGVCHCTYVQMFELTGK